MFSKRFNLLILATLILSIWCAGELNSQTCTFNGLHQPGGPSGYNVSLWLGDIRMDLNNDFTYVTATSSEGSSSFIEDVGGNNSFQTTTGSYNPWYLASYDEDANLNWILNSADLGGYAAACAVDYDDEGNIYVSGLYEHSIEFYNCPTCTTTTVLTGGHEDLFLAKFDNTGNLEWVNNLISTQGMVWEDTGIPGGPRSNNITVSSDGNVYLTWFIKSEGLNNAILDIVDQSTTTNMNLGKGSNFFVLKFDTDGDLIWNVAKQPVTLGATTYAEAYSIDLHNDEDELILGGRMGAGINFDGNYSNLYNAPFIAKLDPSDGSVIWLNHFIHSGNLSSSSINDVVFLGNDIYASGYYLESNTLSFTSQGISPESAPGPYYTFIVHYDEDGDYVESNGMSLSYSNTYDDNVLDLDVSSSEEVIYMAGIFNSSDRTFFKTSGGDMRSIPSYSSNEQIYIAAYAFNLDVYWIQSGVLNDDECDNYVGAITVGECNTLEILGNTHCTISWGLNSFSYSSSSGGFIFRNPSNIDVDGDPNLCEVEDDGDLIAPSKPGSSSFVWSNSSTSNTILDPAAGSYTVTISHCGCVITSNTVSIVDNQIVVNVTPTDPICLENANSLGSASASWSGSGTYTIAWDAQVPYSASSPSGTSLLTVGQHTVTVTEVGSCQGDATFTINAPTSSLNATIDETDAYCIGSGDGELEAAPTNAAGTVSYSWSNGPTTAINASLNPGTYTVTISDDNCTVIRQGVVGESTGSGFTASAIVDDQPTCNGSSSGAISSSPGSGSYTWLWNNSATTATISNLVNGTYYVTITATGTGCYETASTNLTSSGLETWQKASGGNNSPVEDHPVAIVTDANDNVYVAGTFEDQTKFGLNAINAANSAGGEMGSFLVKYDECGDIEWVKHTDIGGTPGTDVEFVDAVLSGSYVYIIGRRNPDENFDFDGTTTSLTPGNYWFILEIVASTGALNNDISISNTLTASDLVYDMELYYNGTSTDFYAGGKQASSGKATVWKITSGGSVSTFVQDQAGSANSQVRDVEFDATNNRMYMCGTASAAFSFTTGPPESVAGVSDAFAVRYTISSGTPTFTNQRKAGASTSPGYAEGLSLEWDGGSYLYLTGNYKVGINNWGSLTSGFDNAFITKLGASDLSHQWSSHADNALGLSWAKANDLCIDASGTVIAAGTFQGSGIRIASGAPGGSPGNSTGTGMWMAAIEDDQTNHWTLSAICSTATEDASGVAIASGTSSTYATGIFEHHLDLQGTGDDLNHFNPGSVIDAVFTLRLGDIYTNGSLGQFYKTSLNDEAEPETGINPMAMTAFPNPTSGNITLEWNNSIDSPLTLTLMDVSGRLVASPKVIDGRTMTAEIDCSSLPAGIYYLNVESAELVWKAKIIKQ